MGTTEIFKYPNKLTHIGLRYYLKFRLICHKLPKIPEHTTFSMAVLLSLLERSHAQRGRAMEHAACHALRLMEDEAHVILIP